LKLGLFPTGVFTAFVASQRRSAEISSLPAAMSFFAVLLPAALSNLTHQRTPDHTQSLKIYNKNRH